jgi:hypothetical protein
MPKIIQDMTLINPLRYFLVILREVFLQGRGCAFFSPSMPLS